jgi:hypothetical protein
VSASAVFSLRHDDSHIQTALNFRSILQTETHVAIQVMAQSTQKCLRERIFFLLDALLIFVDFPMKVSQTT